MNDLSRKQVTVIVLISLLFIQLIVFYVSFIRPAASERASLETIVSSLETELAIQSVQNEPAQEVQVEKETELQGQVPKERQLDQLLLSIQKAELLSESRVESIRFNNYDETIEETPDLATEEMIEAVIQNEDGDTEIPTSDVALDLDRPTGLKLITFEAMVTAPNFTQLTQFIIELEKLNRILRVDGLEFSQLTEEERMIAQIQDQSISMNIQVTTFYYVDETRSNQPQ